MKETRAADVFAYHERSKHHYERYARSPGGLDWANQPNPFRFYEGRPPLLLPFLGQDHGGDVDDLYRGAGGPPSPVTLETIAALLELSLGLSAWKSAGASRWSLRMNPSSGNLHPTEAHLVVPAAESLPAGVYHYNPFLHALEARARLPQALAERLQSEVGRDSFLAGLTSIFWRESWKYGERAFRYCNHDVGHALAALRFSANLLGWRLTLLGGASDEQLETLLGLRRTDFQPLEREHPDLLCLLHPAGVTPLRRTLSEETTAAFDRLEFDLTPNRLSRQTVDWEVIYRAAETTHKPETPAPENGGAGTPLYQRPDCKTSAAEIIRRRRSAVRYDPHGQLPGEALRVILDRTLPRIDAAPFDCGLGEPAVNLLVFVHRVAGLDPGLYFFLRCDVDLEPLRRQCRPDFLWQTVQDGWPLYLLTPGDFRRQATMVSCHQDIAGDGAASFGMIARFRTLVASAPYRYRQLFWESGMIGQVLYLEAEAHGKRGTGIGCYFDDAVHELMGLQDNRYQSLYHFTLGNPIEDLRLSSHPPYHHIDRAGRRERPQSARPGTGDDDR